MAWAQVYGTFTVTQRGTFYVVKVRDTHPAPATYVYVDVRKAQRKADSLRAQGYVQTSGR